MKKFMIEIDFIFPLSQDFVELIPRQRALINKLMKSGIIINYSLSMDRNKLWVILQSISEAEASRIVQSFPIIDFVQFSVHGLMFHNSNATLTPQFWLN